MSTRLRNAFGIDTSATIPARASVYGADAIYPVNAVRATDDAITRRFDPDRMVMRLDPRD